MTNERNVRGLLGTKLGMTQLWDENNKVVPVTVIAAGPCVVTQVRTPETDGYSAVQLGFGALRAKSVTKPVAGHFEAAGVTPRRHVTERGADVRLGQAHHSEEPALSQRRPEPVEDGGVGVCGQQVQRGDAQHRITRRRGVRGLEPHEAGSLDGLRQVHPAEVAAQSGSREAGLVEGVEGVLDLGDDVHAGAVEGRLILIAQGVVGCELAGRQLLREVQERIEGLPRVVPVGIAGAETVLTSCEG